jgi:hypothetical protein
MRFAITSSHSKLGSVYQTPNLAKSSKAIGAIAPLNA